MKPKIKVISSHFGELKQKDIVTKNLTEYCDRHGYELILNFADSIPPQEGITKEMLYYWGKVYEIQKNLFDCDYLLWVDTDTFIYDRSKPLEHFITEDFDFDLLITCENCVQTGAYFFKNTEWTKNLLTRMVEFGKAHNTENINYCDDTLAIIYILDTERYMGHGVGITSTDEENVHFINTINWERQNNKAGDLLSHIKLISNYEFMVKHVHIYKAPIRPFIIHIPGSTKEDKYRFLKYYSDNEGLDWRHFSIS